MLFEDAEEAEDFEERWEEGSGSERFRSFLVVGRRESVAMVVGGDEKGSRFRRGTSTARMLRARRVRTIRPR